MWIEPTPRNPNSSNTGAHWTNLEQNEFFALQSQLSSEAFEGSKLAFAKPFRIILLTSAFPAVFDGKPIGQTSPSSGGDEEHKVHFPVVIIALADEEKDIHGNMSFVSVSSAQSLIFFPLFFYLCIEHWNFLCLNVLPQMAQFDKVREQSDLYVFVTKKISAMATEEDLANLEAPGRRLRGMTVVHSADDKDKGDKAAEEDITEGFKKLLASVGDKSWEKEKNLLVAGIQIHYVCVTFLILAFYFSYRI